MALEPITREEKYLAKAAGQSVSVPEPITRKEMFLDAVAKSGGSGGGSAPSDWNAAEGEPGHVLNRTHYKELAELVNGTAVWNDDAGFLALETDLVFVAGETYVVTYNGVEYTCTAFEYDDEETVMATVGNGAQLGLEDTGEPFFMITMEGMLCCWDYNEATEATIRISSYRYVTIPRNYLPETVHWIDAVMDGDTYTGITVTPAQTAEAIHAGLEVKLRVSSVTTDDVTTTAIFPCAAQRCAPEFGSNPYHLVFYGLSPFTMKDKSIALTVDISSGTENIDEIVNLPWVAIGD